MNNQFFSWAEAFVAIVRAGSITAAAGALKVSKANISQRLTAFERDLGLVLLRRTTRSSELTPAGERILNACVRAVDGVERARALLVSEDTDVAGRIGITGPSEFLARVVVPQLKEFGQCHPRVEFALRGSDSPLNFSEEDIDIGFQIGLKETDALDDRLLFSTRRLLCASPSYLATLAKRLVHPKDLIQACCILHQSGARHWDLENGSSQNHQFTPTSRLLVDSMEMAQSAAIHGNGVALLPYFLSKESIETGKIERVLPNWASPPLLVKIACRIGSSFKPQVVAFQHHMVRHIERMIAPHMEQETALPLVWRN